MSFDLEALSRHSTEMAFALAVVLVDLLVVAGVVVLNWAAGHWIFERYSVSGSAAAAVKVLDVSFTIATLATVLAFLVRDVAETLIKSYRSIANLWAETSGSKGDS